MTNPALTHRFSVEDLSMSNPELFNSDVVDQLRVTSLPETVEVNVYSSTGIGKSQNTYAVSVLSAADAVIVSIPIVIVELQR